MDHNRKQPYSHVDVNVQRLSVVFTVFSGRFLNASTCTHRSWSSAFLLYHVTPQLVAYSTLHLLCKTRPLSLRDSLLESGLPLTSDSTTGFFSVTSTLDGEHRGDSPAAKYSVTVSSKICRNRISLSLSRPTSTQHTIRLLPFLQGFIAIKCVYIYSGAHEYPGSSHSTERWLISSTNNTLSTDSIYISILKNTLCLCCHSWSTLHRLRLMKCCPSLSERCNYHALKFLQAV